MGETRNACSPEISREDTFRKVDVYTGGNIKMDVIMLRAGQTRNFSTNKRFLYSDSKANDFFLPRSPSQG